MPWHVEDAKFDVPGRVEPPRRIEVAKIEVPFQIPDLECE